MTSTTRAALFSAVLLAVFAVGALGLQLWLRVQTDRARSEAAEDAYQTVVAALALAPRAPEQWDEAFARQIGRLIGGTVLLEKQAGPTKQPVGSGNNLVFQRALPGHAGWSIRGEFPAPAVHRLQLVQQRALIALVLLGVLLTAVPWLISSLGSRRGGSDTRNPWRQDAAGLEQFARLTVERGAALEREHGARIRAEEDLTLSRSLLDRSLEERIRLGRELHDNVSQTLYAVTLTLESVRKNMTAAPAIEQRLDQCMAELRRLNQEVRAYLRDLEPSSVQRAPFAQALAETLAAAAGDGAVAIEHKLDDEAVALIPPQHAVEIVNIVREAVSNSVRHGQARRVTVRAARGEREVALAVSDDGIGFQPAPGAAGHGLGNMKARAAALGGTLQVDSAPGKGTRVLLTVPVDSMQT
jgi:signal transduction histidine kinase